MLRALTPGERCVLLAHERSHLRHRHDRYRRLARTAAWLNPLLRPTTGAVDYLLERWADEDAARAVGSRTLAARALARAALQQTGAAPGPAAFAAHHIGRRVDALLRPQAAPRTRAALLLPATLAIFAMLTGIIAVHELAHLYEILRG